MPKTDAEHTYFNKGGTWFKVYGDPGTDQVAQLIRFAEGDLRNLKDSNINDLDILSLERPPWYRIESQFGKDVIEVYPEKFEEVGEEAAEIETEKEEKEITIKYVPAFEVYDDTRTPIGYVIGGGDDWSGPYELLLTDNVIPATYDREETAEYRADNPNSTVDPVLWPVWRSYFGGWGGATAEDYKPFDGTLEDKFVLVDGNRTFYDVACKFEEELWDYYETDLDGVIPETVEDKTASYAGSQIPYTIEMMGGSGGNNPTLVGWLVDVVSYTYTITRQPLGYGYVGSNEDGWNRADWSAFQERDDIDEGYRLVSAWDLEDYHDVWTETDYTQSGDYGDMDYSDLYAAWDAEVAGTTLEYPDPTSWVKTGSYMCSQCSGWNRFPKEFNISYYGLWKTAWFQYAGWSNMKDADTGIAIIPMENRLMTGPAIGTWYLVDPGSRFDATNMQLCWSECEGGDVTAPYEINIWINGTKYQWGAGDDSDRTFELDYITYAQVRYYELGSGDDPSFICLISMMNRANNVTEDEPHRYCYALYRKGADEIEGGVNTFTDWSFDTLSLSTSPTWYHHALPELTAPNGGEVWCRGYFRLFKVIIEEEAIKTKMKTKLR